MSIFLLIICPYLQVVGEVEIDEQSEDKLHHVQPTIQQGTPWNLHVATELSVHSREEQHGEAEDVIEGDVAEEVV